MTRAWTLALKEAYSRVPSADKSSISLHVTPLVVAAVGGLAVLGALSSGAEPMRAATPSPRVTLIGDSVADAIAYVPQAQQILGEGLDLRLELAPCRRLASSSCPYNGVRPPTALDVIEASTTATLGYVVAIDVGYNDPAENFETDLGRVIRALIDRDVEHIVLVTLREDRDSYRTINRVIRAAPNRWPRIEVADWAQESAGRDWFQSDDLHLNADGAIGLARLLRRSILSACGDLCKAAPNGPSPAKPPRSIRLPSLSGIARVGHTLTCLRGSWSGSPPIRTTFGWLRDGRAIPSSSVRRYRLRARDGRTLVACRVRATNPAGSRRATSKPLRVQP